jgi:hypothetical protein
VRFDDRESGDDEASEWMVESKDFDADDDTLGGIAGHVKKPNAQILHIASYGVHYSPTIKLLDVLEEHPREKNAAHYTSNDTNYRERLYSCRNKLKTDTIN